MNQRIRALLFLIAAICLFIPPTAVAQESTGEEIPVRYGMFIQPGQSISPRGDISFAMVGGFAQFDYDDVWFHWAPDNLRWKIEAAVGSSASPFTRAMASLNMFAQYYIPGLATEKFSPYVELGIGGIFMDFQTGGMGSRINFNPQLGIGADFTVYDRPCFSALRLFHVSNAGLHDDNDGMNALTLVFGVYF